MRICKLDTTSQIWGSGITDAQGNYGSTPSTPNTMDTFSITPGMPTPATVTRTDMMGSREFVVTSNPDGLNSDGTRGTQGSTTGNNGATGAGGGAYGGYGVDASGLGSY